MPISMDEFRQPRWIKYDAEATLARDDDERWYKFETDPRGWRDGFKQPGYNPNHDTTSVENVNINSDELQLRGR